MLKILDQIPVWKTLRGLPARIEILERQVAELQGSSSQPQHLRSCAECGAPAKVTGVAPHPVFGAMGVKRRTVTCEAGHSHDFDWDPNKEP